MTGSIRKVKKRVFGRLGFGLGVSLIIRITYRLYTVVPTTLSHTCGQGWLKPFRSDQIISDLGEEAGGRERKQLGGGGRRQGERRHERGASHVNLCDHGRQPRRVG